MFGLCVAFVLLPLLSMSAGSREARAQTATAWMPLQARPQSAAPFDRAGLPQNDAAPLAATPFAAAAAFSLGLSSDIHAGAESASRRFVAAVPSALHLARAPPALP